MEIDPKDIGLTSSQDAQYQSQDGSFNEIEDESQPYNDASSESTSQEIGQVEESVQPSLEFHHQKWKRLKRTYNDQYLDFYNEAYNDDVEFEGRHVLQRTRFGAVTWSADDKEKLFTALAKFGRHDLPRISDFVGTKSVVEVLGYLDAVRQAHVERQLFQGHTKNISLVDIPAAVEVSAKCDLGLEKAADALSAYQEQYDITAGQKEQGSSWLIDHEVASQIDAENHDRDAASKASSGSGDEENENGDSGDRLHYTRLFKLSQMLELSEEYFMNQPDESGFSHWKLHAEPGQRPAITGGGIQTLFDLVSNCLRKILNVAIQVASSRMTSMAVAGYSPAYKLSHSDITTALDILKMPHDAWAYWATLARRNRFQLITGSHSKGESRRRIITYEEAEVVLADRGRKRRRSMSIGSETSSLGSDLGRDVPTSEIEEDDNFNREEGTDGGKGEGSSVSGAEEGNEDEEEQDDTILSLSSSSTSQIDPVKPPRLSREERNVFLEEAMDLYAEYVDRKNSVAVERHLWKILGKRPALDVEEEEPKMSRRPKSLRKTQEELNGWSCNYMAEWEYVGPVKIDEASSPEKRDEDAKLGSENNEEF